MLLDKNKLLLAMARRGFSRSELAEAMGCSAQYINSIMHKKSITTKTLSKLSKALECDPAELVKFTE